MATCKPCIEQDGKSASEGPHGELVCYSSVTVDDKGALQLWRCLSCYTAWERFRRDPTVGRNPYTWIRLIG